MRSAQMQNNFPLSLSEAAGLDLLGVKTIPLLSNFYWQKESESALNYGSDKIASSVYRKQQRRCLPREDTALLLILFVMWPPPEKKIACALSFGGEHGRHFWRPLGERSQEGKIVFVDTIDENEDNNWNQ